MAESRVGVLGASSLVGGCLLPLLRDANLQVVAFSRQAMVSGLGVAWRRLPCAGNIEEIPYWICLAPIWVLPDYFAFIETSGVRRVVVLSSTSRFTKIDSSDAGENAIAVKLADGEAQLQAWATSRSIEWVVLRPTMIYGLGRDKNISEIARFIRRFGFFPVFGGAQGLRQPIHAKDVAAACISALRAPDAVNHACNLSGGETLSYRDMVARVFATLGRRPRFLKVPLWGGRLVVVLLRRFPHCRQWSVAMAERMNCDLVFDSVEAVRDFGFVPKKFVLSVEDMPE